MQPIRAERPMRVVVIGAGASGLCFAYKLQRSFENFTLTIYERQAALGGVWMANRYPGCACDYEAHNYTFSWEPKADWKSVYASAAEVQAYFDGFATKYNLHRFCKFSTAVTSAEWDDGQGCWRLGLQQGTETYQDECDILINASGLLSKPKWPDVPGLDEFAGVKIHSAQWPEGEVPLEGKRIGLIGNGSSGQQLLPKLQPLARQLTVFIRQPTWVFDSFGEAPRDYTDEELERFKDPAALRAKRKAFENRINSYFAICLKDSPQQAALREYLTGKIRDRLAGSKHAGTTESSFIPDYTVSCRRPTPAVGYLETLCADNVDLVHGPLGAVSRDGVVDHQGRVHQLDVLICATGFDTSHRPGFPIVGSNGTNLQDKWASAPRGYLALAVDEFPNYFVFYGPNNPFGTGPFLGTIEAQADYMLKWCDRWQTENIHSFVPKAQAVDELYSYISRAIEKTVWSDSCRAWYKTSPQGKEHASLWPGSGLHYIEALSSLRHDDFDVVYKGGNRWEWLGNGFSQIETDPECDLSYYIRDSDESEYLGSAKRRRVLAKGERVDPATVKVIE